MIKTIKNSLWMKTFLSLTILLFAVTFLLYGIVTAVMPASYRSQQTLGYTEQMGRLVTELENGTVDDAINHIYEFCLNHNAVATLSGKLNTVTFGEGSTSDEKQPAQTATANLKIGEETYQLSVTISGRLVNRLTKAFWNLLPIISLLVLSISIIAASAYTHFLAKPILKISDISKRLAELDMTWRCDTTRTDEVGILARNLNTMAERLDIALRELTTANAKLQEDIEQEHRQEKVRMDFFRAVSHELKTPITVLKGELEGMIYMVGEYKDRDKYLRGSMRTVKEMENLVKEILSISRMAGSDFSLNKAEVNMTALVQSCCRKWQGLAEDKGQQLIADLEECTCMGDRDLLEKAVSNIIGNAVIHSENNSVIRASLKENVLEVLNTGRIPEGELERIFEPLYRVESSHNRKTGGSGLGLYIVKAILDQHGMVYDINNIEGGVRFIVHLS